MVKIIKCPGCGANMQYNAQKQKMYCDFCETELPVEDVEEIKSENKNESKSGDFKSYKCPSCGAELLTDEYTSATFCNFCGNSSLIEDRLLGELMPAQLIPFKINKQEAMNIFKNWTKKGLFTPKGFRKQSTIEKISGIYVPFWLYDYHSRAKINANCTRVRREVIGNTEYIHTDNFKVTRDIDTEYLKVPADASIKMPDDVMDKIEPFDYKEMIDFDMPYLSGFLAEKYNYSSEELAQRVETRVDDYICKAVKDTIQGYSTINVINQDTWQNRKCAKYTLFPVWLLNYRYMSKDYMFAINGQTGRIVGALPLSKGRAISWFAGVSIVSFAILMIIGGIFG